MRDSEALVEGLRAGEPWARAALFEQYAPLVTSMLRKILGFSERTELADVVHDVFIQALASADRIRAPGALPAWMSAVTTRTACRVIRARKARRWLRFWEPSDLPEICVSDVDPDVREAYERAYALLDRMPTHERIAFTLRYVEKLELTEIALACEVSLATIKRRLARAEQRFVAAARREEALRGWLEGGGRWTT